MGALYGDASMRAADGTQSGTNPTLVLVHGSGHTARAWSGVQEQLLGKWVAIERSRLDDPPGPAGEDERAELARLRVENAELRLDREFLKKAAAFFASEPPNR